MVELVVTGIADDVADDVVGAGSACRCIPVLGARDAGGAEAVTARHSKARAKDMAHCRSVGAWSSTSVRNGSGKPSVNN